MSSVVGFIAQAAENATTLTLGGAAMMTVSVLLVLSLAAFCFWRILHEPSPSEHHHAPLDINTKDLNG